MERDDLLVRYQERACNCSDPTYCQAKKTVERPATDADLARMGYVKLDGIDAGALRDDYTALMYAIDHDVQGDIQSPMFRRFVELAKMVLAALDQEDT